MYKNTPQGLAFRGEAEVARFFHGLDLTPPYEGAEPGVSDIGAWGAEDHGLADDEWDPEGGGATWGYCGVARKP